MPRKKFYKALYLQTGFCLGPHNPYGSSPGRDPLTLKLSKVENLKTLLVLLFINCNILKKKIHLMFGLQHTFFFAYCVWQSSFCHFIFYFDIYNYTLTVLISLFPFLSVCSPHTWAHQHLFTLNEITSMVGLEHVNNSYCTAKRIW